MCPESENPHFSQTFLNIDILLVIALICLKLACMFLRYNWREACLKILIQGLVLVLYVGLGGGK